MNTKTKEQVLTFDQLAEVADFTDKLQSKNELSTCRKR